MSDRYLPNSVPMTLIVAENYSPTSQIGETEEDILDRNQCLRELGDLPNHRYVMTKGTDHKVWAKDPKTVVNEIGRLYEPVGQMRK